MMRSAKSARSVKRPKLVDDECIDGYRSMNAKNYDDKPAL
ncbi:hypothetical protein GQ600_16580 [Phytophthora cactorum]|nr:hypothetical protein GQ600_16580 [Phytophthora cactorum]